MPFQSPIKRALISVSDKTGIVDFAKQLCQFNIELLSTGGTANLLRQHNIPVVDVAQYTGAPEIMDGRVKTLHPKIHGGLLGRRGEDDLVMSEQHILPIDLLIVNLYPFVKTVADPQCDLATAIENIDIGGPTMLRAAAKNYAAVTVIVDAKDYSRVIAEMQNHGGATTLATRLELAKKVFATIASYDAAIANYFGTLQADSKPIEFPDSYTVQFEKKQDLRYGENPHQKAAFYTEKDYQSSAIATAKQLQGKELSYNNIADSDAAYECVKSFSDPACVIVKHANPCGVALGTDILEAYQKAYKTDPISAFGGIIACNRPLTADTAKAITDQQFVEVIIAPGIEEAALNILKLKPNIRVLSCTQDSVTEPIAFDYKRVAGGLLIQEQDQIIVNKNELKIVTQRTPTTQEQKDLLFAWQVAKFVKSNAIVFAKDQATIGIGAGQMSRVDSVEIAVSKAKKAGLSVAGAVMASDAFFPFRDGIDEAAKVGIVAIIQPGGSMRDQEIIQAADAAKIAMIFTALRHFRH